MTFPEVLAMGKARLEKYAPLLENRVKGKRPFSQSAVAIRKRYSCGGSLASVRGKEIEPIIDALLEELAGVEGGLVISEPEPLLGAHQEGIATHGDLYLSASSSEGPRLAPVSTQFILPYEERIPRGATGPCLDSCAGTSVPSLLK